MNNRNMRGIRSVGVKARLAVAAAVLVGGGAVGVVAVAANHGGSATAESAGYTRSYHSTTSETLALDEALNSWSSSQSRAVALVAELTQFRSFVQLNLHHTTIDAQRGIVVLATKKFLVVKSFNGSLHLWWLSGATGFKNVDSTMTGWTALTGSHSAATAAMTYGNMTPASTLVAGSTSVVSQMTTPVAKPTTITIDTGGTVITITVASSTAAVAQTTASTTWTHQSVWSATHGVQRGDLVVIAGTRTHGQLKAQFVLFASPRANMPTPSASPTATIYPTSTAFPTAVPTPNTTISGEPAYIGKSS
jgi:hypothetical protein